MAKVIHSSSTSKIVVTPRTRRLVDLWYLDNENTFKKCVGFPESEEKARIMAVYTARKQELEDIAKGLVALPDVVTYAPIDIEASVSEPIATGYVYGYAYYMREIKDCLEQALGLGAKPHAQETDEVGVFQFRVQNCIRRELQETKRLYPDLVLDVWFPEIEVAKSRGEKVAGKQRVTPVAKVRVTLHPAIQEEVTTRKATKKELELLHVAEEKHVEDGLAHLEQI